MLVGLRALSATITDIDLIIETRDARIPLSSRNPYLEDVCAQRRRLVLYNKRDLAGLTDKQQQVPSHLALVPLCVPSYLALLL
jgi:ribosome biogenesis GTPase A